MNEHIRFFAKYIEQHLGIVYNETNAYQLENRLEQVAKLYNFENVTQLYNKAVLGIDSAMRQSILDISTNNETYFFRDTSLFSLLKTEIFPSIFSKNLSQEGVKIWCSASSTGQEPYSICMILTELFPFLPNMEQCLVATDISKRVLERVKEGVYSELEVKRGLTDSQLKQFFTPVNGESSEDSPKFYKVKPELKKYIRVQEQNLLESFALLPKFDLILCRNVLIYQSVKNKMEVISKMYDQLKPEGILILGAAENLYGLSNDFDQLQGAEGAIYFRKKG